MSRILGRARSVLNWLHRNLALLVAVTSIAFTVVYVHVVERDFCGVVTAATATPVQRPSDPAANPSREQSWEWYERFVRLGESLGC